MRKPNGFTLVELVIVVMIIGILLAIAFPKTTNVTREATDNSVWMSLRGARFAIEMYALHHNGSYPDDKSDKKFKAAIKPHLQGVFPSSLVGKKNNKVKKSKADPVVADDKSGWMYNGTTGEFIINCTAISRDGSTAYSEF